MLDRWIAVYCLLLTQLCCTICAQSRDSRPNIVFIIADDLGWNDIGFNNPDIISPHLDDLANNGIILNQSYVQPLCSPSRAALMTGVYPFRYGLQHIVIIEGQPVCAPSDRAFLSEILQETGYATHLIGKWHLGFCSWHCTPTFRGFDSFFGFYTAMEDFFNKDVDGGFDFRDNEDVHWAASGTYSTFQYTDRIKEIIKNHDNDQPLFLYLALQSVHTPLQVPQQYYNMYPDINEEKRRNFSGMVTAMDDIVGELVSSLKQKGLYDNTIIVFTSDNGGSVTDGGNNFPLRSSKGTNFEGGTRAVGFVHGSMLSHTGSRYDGLMHIVDWFPTLLEAAGVELEQSDLDGISQWQSLQDLTTPFPRDEIVYNMDLSDDPVQGRVAIRVGDYKLIDGFPGYLDGWYVPEQVVDFDFMNFMSGVGKKVTEKTQHSYLFNLRDDPYEHNNLFEERHDIVQQLKERIDHHRLRYVPPNFPESDPASSPDKWGGVWSPGWC